MKKPFGIVFVSTCETLLSLIVGLLGLMYLCYGFYGVLHSNWSRVANSSAIAAVLLGIAAGFYFTSVGLLNRSRWAWLSSLGIALLVAIFGLYCIYASRISEQPTWGEGLGVFLLILVLFAGVILLLPSTRSFFQKPEASSSR